MPRQKPRDSKRLAYRNGFNTFQDEYDGWGGTYLIEVEAALELAYQTSELNKTLKKLVKSQSLDTANDPE